ncbi:MAG: tetratricopeptide repeat protein [Actinobacteria bacterium]|nr:tetratricopeptide repeat protein [Actinomycetota bacterium]
MSDTWAQQRDAFWQGADDNDPNRAHRDLDLLLEGRPEGDAVALFERASLHDYLGEEAAAIPLYRAALDAGLDDPYRTEGLIQLASSLRNTGDASGAIALLRGIPDADPLADAARAFLALALFDDQKPAAALRTALHALTPHLSAYRRSLDAYAHALIAPPRVRNVVVGLVVRDGHVLAEEYVATAHHDFFLRAPGGGLEFGESTNAGIRREFAEELGAVLDDIRPLGVLENVFESGPKRGHEIVHVFAVESASLDALATGERMPVLDADTTVGWYDIAALREGAIAFYPPGILDLLP